ncbi:MAG: pilus assembly protein PilM [Candidatus Pacebacteria bacterium]|jgi:type IV pilus assembly protein PilM|nr:pilus assembly protein PilM [Candidatus Paceibacterota bacterium]
MARSKFYQFFPPPQFVQMPAVGLDISDTSMRFVELVEKRKGFVIGAFGEYGIPQGVIESGEVKKPEELRALFLELKKEHPELEFVSVSLPEEKAYLFELRLPIMKYSEVRGSIEFGLEEHVPLTAAEALFDYEIIKEDNASIYASVSVVPRTLVEGYLEAFKETGITPIAFEMEAHSLARAVIPRGDTETCMIVDFGKTRTGIAIISDGVVQFTSTIPVGGTSLTESIAKNLKIAYDEAEKIKREKGISGSSGDENLFLAVMSTISVLREEINKHQTYWQEHADSYGNRRLPIKKIYLCGGDSVLAGFPGFLATGLSSPVELSNTMVNVNTLEDYIPEISFNDSLRYAAALGLALRRPQ